MGFFTWAWCTSDLWETCIIFEKAPQSLFIMNVLKVSQIYFIQYYQKHQWRDFSWEGFEVGGISNWVIFLMKTAFDNPFLHSYTIVCLYPYQLSLWFQNPCLHEMKKQAMSVSLEAFCGLSLTIPVPTSLLHQSGIMRFNGFCIAAVSGSYSPPLNPCV